MKQTLTEIAIYCAGMIAGSAITIGAYMLAKRFWIPVILLFLTQNAQAQWGKRAVCVVTQPVITQTSTLEWVADRSAPGQIDLVRDNWKLVGAYDPETKIYRRLIDFQAQQWSEPEALPRNVPLPPGGVIEQASQNFGIVEEKLHAEQEGFFLSGRPCSKEEAYYFTKHGLPEDKGKPQVTVIGDNAKTKAVYETLVAANAHNDAVIRLLPDDHWQLRDNDNKLMFQVGDEVNVYIQKEDGEVIHHQADDQDVVEAVRKAKELDHKKVPDLRQPISLPAILPNIPPVAVVGGVLLLVLLFTKKKEPQ